MGCEGSYNDANRQRIRRRELNRQANNQLYNGGYAQNTNQYAQNTYQNVQNRGPTNTNLPQYSKANQQYYQKQDLKKVAQNKNLHLKRKMIDSKFNISMNSIRLTHDEEQKNLYDLVFTYSATENAKISIYFWATQMCNTDGVPTGFSIESKLPKAIQFEVEQGIDVEIDREIQFDESKYKSAPIMNSTSKYFPWVIIISSAGKSKTLESGLSDSQSLITYWNFNKNKTTNTLEIEPFKQVLIALEMGFCLQQIYGISDALEEDKDGDTNNKNNDVEEFQLCVICITEAKDTVVMPWGHLWVCKQCAIAIANQN